MKKIKVILIAVASAIVLVLAGIVIVANVKYSNAKKAEEARLLEKEKVNAQLLEEDTLLFSDSEYDAVILSMQGSQNWSAPGTVEGYLGLVGIKNRGELSGRDLFALANTALDSDNNIQRMYMILDPYKMFEYKEIESDEKTPEYSFDQVCYIDFLFDEYPGIEFTIYTPFYQRSYWDSVKFAEYENVMYAYRTVLESLLSYDNVSLMIYTGDKWLLENDKLFEDGDLAKEVYEKMFLYSFKEDRLIDEEALDIALSKVEENCLTKTEPEPKEKGAIASLFEKPPVLEPLPLENYDVVFMGDSIFANTDDHYSSATVFANKTGARTYNISIGGMSASEMGEGLTLLNCVDHFVNETPMEKEGVELYDRWLKTFYEDDHSGRELVFIFDTCTNDYIASFEAYGDDEYSVEGAMKKAVSIIKGKYPKAKFIFLKPYIFPLLEYGTVKNDRGYVFEDYRKVFDKICGEEGHLCYDLQKYVNLNEENCRYYLDDAVHPSIEGFFEIANTTYANIEKDLTGQQ